MKYLDYIQFSGSSYIDTQIVPTLNTRVEIYDLQLNNIGWYKCIFGASNGDVAGTIYRVRTIFGSPRQMEGYLGTGDDTERVSVGQNIYIKKLLYDKNEFYIDTIFEQRGFTHSPSALTYLNSSMYINCENRNGTPTDSSGDMIKFRNFKIYESNTLIADYYAAQDDNNIYCLYDKVSGNYLYNAGSGSITGGTEYTTEGNWESVTTAFDRSKKITKIAWNYDVPTLPPTNSENGYFSELPNINTNGMAWSECSGITYGYASENRFNLAQDFFSNHEDNFTNQQWSSSTYTSQVDLQGYLFICPKELYWSGVHHITDANINSYLEKLRVYTLLEKITISKNEMSFGYSGGSDTLGITSPLGTWSASTNDNWISVSPSTGDTGDTTVTITVQPTNYAARTGTVTFTDGTDSVTLSISQSANNSIKIDNLYYNGSKVKQLILNNVIVHRNLEDISQ